MVDNNTSMVTNTESSKSHILDTDFAVETTKLTRTQILQQVKHHASSGECIKAVSTSAPSKLRIKNFKYL